MIKSYFEAACAIDVHNHLRQDGLGMENAIGTSKWWIWLMYTIFGMIEVDTFKTFCHFNRHIQVPSHRNFIERLVILLLTNSKSGAPEPTPFQLQLQKRKRNDSGEDEDSDVECAVEHQIMSITQYLNARDSGSKASKQTYIHTCENYLPHHSCSVVCYVVLIIITFNTIVDTWKYNTDMHVTP